MVQARLDTLGSDAKRVLRAASIFGQSFRREGVSALISDRDRAAIATSLGVLVEREVILAEGGGGDQYVFRHALLRDAAYAMLTEGDRGLGHLLAGEWLEQNDERDAIVLVEHFERAAIARAPYAGAARRRRRRWRETTSRARSPARGAPSSWAPRARRVRGCGCARPKRTSGAANTRWPRRARATRSPTPMRATTPGSRVSAS